LHSAESDPFENKSHAGNVNSERRTPDMIPLRPRPQIKLTTAAVMGQRKEGGAVAVCQDDNDGTVLCSSEDGMTVRCLVTTHFQDEDQNKDGERAAVCSIFILFLAF
jgi:hypothetical protein